MGKLIMLATLVLGLAAHCNAEKPQVYIACSVPSDDTIGKRLCTALRDAIAKSPRYREADNLDMELHWTLHLASVKLSDLSAQSIAITYGSGTLLDYKANIVTVTGRDRVDQQAQTLIADLDDLVTNVHQ
jgi:hypothetical protein